MPSKLMFYDKNGKLKSIDEIIKLGGEGSVVMLTHFEYETHQGNVFTASCEDAALGDGDTLAFCFKTGGSKKIHLAPAFSTLVGGYCEVWKGATWATNTGTATAIKNRSDYGNVPAGAWYYGVSCSRIGRFRGRSRNVPQLPLPGTRLTRYSRPRRLCQDR